jgi:hypothetical protein
MLSIRKRMLSVSCITALGIAWGGGIANPVYAFDATSRLATYQEDNRTHFALSLVPAKELPKLQAPRVAVIVDTSASQNGDFRTDSIDVAQSIVEALSEHAKVCVLACDVKPVVLAKLTSPKSESLNEAWQKLERRIPLGTTDLAGALLAAHRELGDQPDASIIYIGDGFHLTNMLNASEFESVVDLFRESRTSIHSLAIGPRTNCELLAVLSAHTGGRVLVRQNITNATCQQIGHELAKIADTAVFWPSNASLPKQMNRVLPAKLPPVRSDRDSILIGEVEGETVSGTIVMQGVVAGREVSMEWKVASEANNPDFAFLPGVVEKAASSKGLWLPTSGSDALRELGLSMANSSDQLVKDARFALNTGNIDAAINIATEALKRSPGNLTAQNILEAASKVEKPSKPVNSTQGGSKSTSKIVKFITAQVGGDPQPPTESNPFGDDPPAAKTPVPSPFPAATPPVPQRAEPAPLPLPSGTFNSGDAFGELANASDLLAEEEAMRKVAAQQLEALVRSELGAARMSKDPSTTKMTLKALQDQIKRAPELDAGGRARLESQVSSAIQSAARAEAAERERIARAEAVQSSQAASKRLLAETERRNATVQQLVERYNSLMAQQLFSAANNEIAPQITAIDRDSTIDVVTNLESNIAANEQLIRDVVSKRNRAFVDTMYLNELALIPFVDEPPVRYPPADVWQALSARRIERYGSIDLSGGNEAERTIFRALNERKEVNFNAQPLSAVMRYFSDEYNIPIVIDDKALEDESISPDEPVTLTLPPVSFRSALKLILEPLQLTYVIEDEVMRITSKQTSANVVRVYPVGDLVVPVSSMGGMMGGMGGMMGGMGGMGGGMMGGMGGGMGGMGGGMMGGMGGGMGGMGGMMGGMMDVNDQPKKTSATKTPDELVAQLVGAEGGEKLAAEAELSKWVVSKMNAAKKAAMANNESEVRLHFQEIIDTVGDAMRKTLPAGWMYTALSTAMEGCEYPSEDIHRVLLSSIDFGGDEEAALKIAKYLGAHNMKKEAISVYRDIHFANPMLKEPLEEAMKLALETEDQSAIRWVCTGILGQAWSDDQVAIIEKAALAAKAAYIRLNNNQETMKAFAFKEELNQARKRDIVVRAVWTGNADVDIAIEEPTGTICDKQNTRTSSGGLLLGDASSLDKASKDGFSETYVCTTGYSGQYRILVRKVWGDVTGGTVTVNIVTDYGTENQSVVQQQIPVGQGGKDALVIAEVKNGRRTTPVYEAQLATVQKKKIESSKAVLAQAAPPGIGSGGSNFESGAYMQQLASQYAGGGAVAGNPFFPFVGRGAVGYQPVIQTIPAGTQMSVFGVVSGDRRYVQLAPSPFFSDIVAVDTFNTVTGNISGGGGGSGLGGGAGTGGGGGGFGGGGAF